MINKPQSKFTKTVSAWCNCRYPDTSPRGTDTCRKCLKKVWKDIKGTGKNKPY